jgi:hypothetical protein
MRISDFHTKAMTMEIKVHVYDLIEQNEYLYSFGLGAFHTGVEIGGEGAILKIFNK